MSAYDEVTRWPDEPADAYRAAGYWTGETFGELLRRRAAEHPDREAVAAGDGRTRWTYAELDAHADAVARALAAAGLVPGDRLVLHLPNEAEFVRVLLGCLRFGVVPVMALPAHREGELIHLTQLSEAAALVTAGARPGADFPAIAARVQAECPTLRLTVVTDGEPGPGQRPLDDFLAAGRAGAVRLSDHPAPRGDDLALLQLSGGTTGLPKLIPRTHDDYRYSVERSAEICALTGASRYLVVLPAAHNFPLSSPGILGVLAAGGTVVLCPSADPATALKLIETERITITGIVPPLALAWLEAAPVVGADLRSLRVLQVGGARLEPTAARRVQPELGAALQQVFGMAEGLVNYTRLDDPLELVIESQGRPMSPADEVRVVDAADRDVPTGEPGALLTRGPYTIRGYWRAPDHNAGAFTADGFYRTGDLVRQLPTGHLVVVGRSKDQINRGGEKVSPSEIEDHLLAHPGVLDACVIPLPDERLGERIWAVVVPRETAPNAEGGDLTAIALRRWVRERGIAAFKVPDRISFLPEFPTTGVGKVSRRDLRASVAAQLATPKES